MRLQNKVAIITGAGSGIGRESAILFAQEGAWVMVADLVGEAARETAALAGHDAVSMTVDVSNWADVKKMIDQTVQRFGRIDVLFNNAGIYVSGAGAVTETSEADWDRMMAVNLTGVFLGVRHVLPIMIAQRYGVIVSTSSQAGVAARPSMAAYCATKAGILSLTRQLAVDYGRYNIRVNAICPGVMEKPMGGRDALQKETPEKREKRQQRVEQSVPLRRFCTARELACGALYLASHESVHVTGIALVVDGGFGAQ